MPTTKKKKKASPAARGARRLAKGKRPQKKNRMQVKGGAGLGEKWNGGRVGKGEGMGGRG